MNGKPKNILHSNVFEEDMKKAILAVSFERTDLLRAFKHCDVVQF